MPKETCKDCSQTICTQVQAMVFLKKVGMTAPVVVEGKIENCPKKKDGEPAEDINSWFELEGKLDTIHLGS